MMGSKKGYIYTISIVLIGTILSIFVFNAYTQHYSSLISQRIESSLPRAQQEFDFVAAQSLDLAKNRVRISGNSTFYNVTVTDVLPHRADNMDFINWSAYGYYLNGSYYGQSHSNLTVSKYFSNSNDGMNTTFRLSAMGPGAAAPWNNIMDWRRGNANSSNFTYTKSLTQNMSVSVRCQNASTMSPAVVPGSDSSNPFYMKYSDPNRAYAQTAIASGGASEDLVVFFIEFNSSAPSINFTLRFVNETPVLGVGGGAQCEVNASVTTNGLNENYTVKYDFNTLLNYTARAGDVANVTKSAVIGRYMRDPEYYAAPIDDSQP
jgi:hypothetical protein